MIGELQNLILCHYKKYPKMQIADILKLIYQNEFGCGHMISNHENSLDMILAESAEISQNSCEYAAAEPIGNGLCRLYLSILKGSLTAETLNRFFVITANQLRGNAASFEEKVSAFKLLSENEHLPFNVAEISQMMKDYRAADYPAIRHSLQYREEYAPAYRVVDKSFCDFLPLFCRIDELIKQKNHVICAIDGGCTSGKTTLASLLKLVYECNVFSMDDFFLQPCQRNAERLTEPGGNIDYERFSREVLKPLLEGCPFTYRPYDCATQRLTGEVAVQHHKLNIVEGVYSLHPTLIEAYDLKVFLEIDEKEQKKRLVQRNKKMYNRFVQEWIPMENKYFKAFQVLAQCELVLIHRKIKETL